MKKSGCEIDLIAYSKLNEKFVSEFDKSEFEDMIEGEDYFSIVPYEKIVDKGLNVIKYVFFVKIDDNSLSLVELERSELADKKWIKVCDPFLPLFNTKKYEAFLKYFKKAFDCIFIRKVLELDYMGFVNINSKWYYLSTDQTIGEKENGIEVRTSREEFKFECLYDDAKLCYLKTLEMLDVLDRTTTLPLFAFNLTAIISTPLSSGGSDVIPPDFKMWLYGSTGYGKSHLAELFTCYFSTKNLIGIDESMKLILQSMENSKDNCLIIDNLGRQKTPQATDKEREKVDKIIHCSQQAILSNVNITSNRASILFTAEKYFTLDTNEKKYQSSNARCYRVKMGNLCRRKSDNRFKHSRALDEDIFNEENYSKYLYHCDKKYYKTSMRNYIDFLVCFINEQKGLDEYKNIFFRNHDDIKRDGELAGLKGFHGRIMDTHSHLLTNVQIFLQYGLDKGYISYDHFRDEFNKAKHIMFECTKQQKMPISDPIIDLFFIALNELICNGELRIIIKEDLTNCSRSNKELPIGILSLHENTLELKWEKVYNQLLKLVNLNEDEDLDMLPSNKVMGKKLRDGRFIIEIDIGGRKYSTRIIKNSFYGREETGRYIVFKTAKIPHIVEAILMQNNYDKSMERMAEIEKLNSEDALDYNYDDDDGDGYDNEEYGEDSDDDYLKSIVSKSLREIDINFNSEDETKKSCIDNTKKPSPYYININMG